MAQNYWDSIATRRIGRRRALALTGGTAAAAALLAACGGSDGGSSEETSGLITNATDTSGQAKRGGISKHFLRADLNGFDTHVPQAPLRFASDQVYGRLVLEKAGHLEDAKGEIEGYMADHWEWSDDLMQLTLKLRPNTYWHNKAPVNGRAFDTEDVLASWNRFATKSNNRGLLANSANPQAPVLSVEAPDRNTIVFKLKEPLVYLLGALGAPSLGNMLLVPKETDDTFDIRADMIGTGPFMMTDFRPSIAMTLKRFDRYYDSTLPYIDTIEAPILSEYATALAQLKAGNVYTFDVRAEDVLSVKNEAPDLNLYQGPQVGGTQMIQFGWHPEGRSPFLDERVRQAFSMSWDRDLYIDTFGNVSKFEGDGLPVETRWHTAVPTTYPGWWLDPKSREFGDNSRYFMHDIAEAKKLLEAAGYPNGLDMTVTYIGGSNYGIDYQKQLEVLVNFTEEAGFRTRRNVVDYVTEFPKYRDVQGRFEGWTSKASGGSLVADSVSEMMQWFSRQAASSYVGYDVDGRGDQSGDPQVDDALTRARGEVDDDKRRSIVYELQRYLAKKMYSPRWPGTASGCLVAWPALANFNVYRGDTRNPAPVVGVNYNCWIDETKPPITRA